ncbi:KilA-N domain-containing protein [Psittacicella hinzii]|uniref:KilA/APSES-type HTH DNA-binding domain-containing protein n=1 Tax=Psittacicella hinzii TaxID=2028575 RepID=A0A3A1YSE0_9GAMM|nr:KilA-N domain-containing protein [Psittacicella hinzii]RIY39304.1 hypothetical protein CKF58_02365 [Psittacicella hinzii]
MQYIGSYHTELAELSSQVSQVEKENYFNLNEIAQKFSVDPYLTICNWLQQPATLDLLVAWEQLHNQQFNLAAWEKIKSSVGSNSFALSPVAWVSLTQAQGLYLHSRDPKIVLAHPALAMDFTMWISPSYRLKTILEYMLQRSKRS